MKLEDQVCSLELAKKLKELGYPQEGLFWWIATNLNGRKYYKVFHQDYAQTHHEMFVAPTVAELGEWLPKYIEYGEEVFNLEMYPPCYLDGRDWHGKHSVGYWKHGRSGGKKSPHANKEAETEANARAKMLIWLKENNYVEFK